MANDRLRIKCKFCKDERVLYKYYPGGGGYSQNCNEEFSEWLDNHVHRCNPKIGDGDMGGEETFKLYCENAGE